MEVESRFAAAEGWLPGGSQSLATPPHGMKTAGTKATARRARERSGGRRLRRLDAGGLDGGPWMAPPAGVV